MNENVCMLSTENCHHCVVAGCDRDMSVATQRVSINSINIELSNLKSHTILKYKM